MASAKEWLQLTVEGYWLLAVQKEEKDCQFLTSAVTKHNFFDCSTPVLADQDNLQICDQKHE